MALTAGSGRRLIPAGGDRGEGFDPLAYRPERAAALQSAAADSLSHVLFVKSPGGILASARRTAALRPQIEAAARAGPIDAETIEAIVLLESAGRADVVAGADLRAAVGVTQILATTATSLLGMRVDLAASRQASRQIAVAHARHDARRETRLRAVRARLDQRFDPAASLAATERYLALARRRLGRDDLAVESYHMGIGNLERALRLFSGATSRSGPVSQLVSDRHLDYARLYFDSSPIDHPGAFGWLAHLGDDSATYLWRVQAARSIMSLYRRDPAQLSRLAALHAGPSAEHVLRPPSTPTFATPAALAAGRASHTLVPVPSAAAGAQAGVQSASEMVLRPEALAVALYLGAGVREIGHDRTPLQLTSATVDSADAGAAARAGAGASDGDPIHATGYAFDVGRRYRTPAQAHAFQFMLDRLAVLDVIAWRRYAAVIEIVAGPGAERLRAALLAHR